MGHGLHVRVAGRGKWLILPAFLDKLEPEPTHNIGDRVQITGLTHARLLHLNGSRGTVVETTSAGVHVKVDTRGKCLVLPAFLRKVEEDREVHLVVPRR